jgi:site-specific DNA-cytosine methylase
MNRAGEDNVDVAAYIDNEEGNKRCVDAYNLFYGTKYLPTDIMTFDFRKINRPIDIAIASVPSNSFTDDNFKLGHTNFKVPKWLVADKMVNERLSIAQSLIDFFIQCQPRVLFIDLTLGQNGKQQRENLNIFLNEFRKFGANIIEDEYKAYNFNAPQDRTRNAIMIFRRDVVLSKPFKFPRGVETPYTYKDILIHNYPSYVVIPELNMIKYKSYGKNGTENGMWIHLVKNTDKYLNTIEANYGIHNGGHSPVVPCREQSGYRYLTPLEIFRAMGLKDSYYELLKLYFSEKELYRLAGNSMIGTYMDSVARVLLNIPEFRVWEN